MTVHHGHLGDYLKSHEANMICEDIPRVRRKGAHSTREIVDTSYYGLTGNAKKKHKMALLRFKIPPMNVECLEGAHTNYF
jgi:hypothetical protein